MSGPRSSSSFEGTSPTDAVASGLPFAEGPRWHGDALWFSDFVSKVYRVVPGSEPEVVCEVPGGPSGLGFDPQGRPLVVSIADRRLLRLQGDRLVEHSDLSALSPAPLNDMVVTADGGAYVGNIGDHTPPGSVWPPAPLIYVDPDGDPRVVGDDLHEPNGIVITGDGETLLVSETLAARVTAFTIRPDGELVDRRVWARLGPEPEQRDLFTAIRTGPTPDGIALDAEGALWVGNAAGAALRIAEGGEVLDQIDVPGFCVYAVALGGPDLRTLFMCVAPPLSSYWPELEAFLEGRPEVGKGGLQAKVLACPVAVAGVSG